MRFYGDRPRAGDARDPIESERDWIDVDAEEDGDGDPAAGLPPARTFGPGTRPLTWKEHLGALRHAMDATREDTAPDWPPGREVLYVVDPAATIAQGTLVLEVLCRDLRKRGGYTQLRRLGLRRTQLAALPDAADRQILALLGGTRDPDRLWLDSHPSYGAVSHRYLVPQDLHGSLMPLVCGTGRGWLRASPADGGSRCSSAGTTAPPSRRPLDVRADPKTGYYIVTGSLCRGAERVELSAVRLLLAGGLVFTGERVARLDDGGAFPWLAHLRRHGSMRVPLAQGGAFLDALLRLPRLPRLDLPDELKYEEITAPPRPRLRVRAAPSHWGSQRLRAALSFDYDGAVVRMDRDSAGVFQAERRRFLRRDASAEQQAAARLRQAGFGERIVYESDRPRKAFDLPARDLARAVGPARPGGLARRGRGQALPPAGRLPDRGQVRHRLVRAARQGGPSAISGAPLPELLAALRRRREHRAAGRRHLRPAARGVAEEVRDAGRAGHAGGAITCGSGGPRSACSTPCWPAQPEASVDARFARARERAARRSRASSRATRPPGSRAGCAAISATASAGSTSSERFGFGGCLADDMGLGKTVQVLALLESRRAAREAAARTERPRPGPSLVVVPRSLVFNWKQEAARFTPKLRVLDHTGAGRGPARASTSTTTTSS